VIVTPSPWPERPRQAIDISEFGIYGVIVAMPEGAVRQAPSENSLVDWPFIPLNVTFGAKTVICCLFSEGPIPGTPIA
jgi:hypothetical protein